MKPAFVWNEWNVQNAIWSRAFRPSVSFNLITRDLTIFQKLRKSQRCSKSVWTADRCCPRSLWLLLVTSQSYPLDLISCNCHPEHCSRKRNIIQKGKDITEQWWTGSNGRSKKIPILLPAIFTPSPVISFSPWTRLFERLVKVTSGLLTWGQNCVVRRDARD